MRRFRLLSYFALALSGIRVDEALFFVQHPFVAKFIGNTRQDLTQNFAVAP
jgi:hypothetical protein